MPNSNLVNLLQRTISGCFVLLIMALPVNAGQDCRVDNSRVNANGFSPQQQALWQDLVHLSSAAMQGRKSGTEGAQLARQYIARRFQESGLEPLPQKQGQDNSEETASWFHTFTPPGLFTRTEGANVIGQIKGQHKPDKFLVLSAHYDHLGKQGRKIHFGANDNASGVAALIYIAQQLSQTGSHHSILFLATDYEEAGLYGAAAFVQQGIPEHADILMNINMDMLAQPGRNWTLYVAGTRGFPEIKPAVERVLGNAPICAETGMDRVSRSYDRSYRIDWRKASDHWEFAQQDIAWLYLGVKDFKYHHTIYDTPDKLSRPFYTGVVETAWQLVVAVDSHFSHPK